MITDVANEHAARWTYLPTAAVANKNVAMPKGLLHNGRAKTHALESDEPLRRSPELAGPSDI